MEIEYRHMDTRVVRLETEIAHLATKTDLAQMETRMTRWMIATVLTIAAVAAAAISVLVSTLA